MVEWLLRLDPWQQALAGTAFTYFMTALGAGLVFFFKEIKKEVLNLMLGFASGVMIARSSDYKSRRKWRYCLASCKYWIWFRWGVFIYGR